MTFSSSIRNCGWFATRGDNSWSVGGNGEIAVEQSNIGDTKTVVVTMFDSGGVIEDPSSNDGFNLQVICP